MSSSTMVTFGVRTPSQVVKLSLPAAATIADAKRALAAQLGHAAPALSRTPQGDAPLADALALGAAGVAGKLVFLIVPKAAAAAAAPPAAAPAPASAAAASAPPAARKLTARCGHGPRGACQHCAPASDAELAAASAALLNKAAAWNARAAERSTATAGAPAAALPWLCAHAADAM